MKKIARSSRVAGPVLRRGVPQNSPMMQNAEAETPRERELKMEVPVHQQLEPGLAELTQSVVEAFESAYDMPAELFTDELQDRVKACMAALERQKEILARSGIENVSIPAVTHLSLAKMGLDAMIAKHEKRVLLRRNRELLEMNVHLRQLYEDAQSKVLVQKHPVK